ncbi:MULTISPECIES: Ger(x)C family spore germination protein [Paenibacillus]|uniref:Ger(x)C family spore germination protein n=1 Tax=Paenibacillus TaxID=44249 RepID=UPI000B82083E|nr:MULTISPECIES: Ger(x)C family spore germination protein [Paenibacillus]MBD8837212.1 Ger(x)C family spore germination protein [Paenibacillus sp. CFBP 13594]PRA07551.1 Ger(x)C family spore germination protein [Paenibacillus sp. MYb63]PRA51196.1 Ger(x)C family spore germination protein [Paenibacillus sp. MYb67]QZN74321.1 Ger(x)C family spore germination protein [Paenibacillus sp. DR312]
MNSYRSRILKPLVYILLMVVVTGCWNSKELNEISVVIALGIDTVDDQYEISLQVVDPSQMSRNRAMERSPTIVFSSRADTLFEAIRKLTTESSRKMYMSHLKFVIFDENTARKGIKKPLDFLFRDHEVRPDFHLAIVRGSSAKDAVSFVAPTEVLPAMDMYKALKVSEKTWAPTSAVDVKDLLQRLTKDGIEPVLTGIRLNNLNKGLTIDNVKKSPQHVNYLFTGIGVFQGDRLTGWIEESKSKAFTYISNRVSSTVASVSCPNSEGKFAFEVIHNNVKIIPKIKDNEPHITLEVDTEANIGEVTCNADLKDEKTFNAFQDAGREEQEKILKEGIQNAQQIGSDIFGFGEAFHRKYPYEWHKWKADWTRKFQNLQVDINLRYRLNRVGKITNSVDSYQNN